MRKWDSCFVGMMGRRMLYLQITDWDILSMFNSNCKWELKAA